jgi:hypothetical protein
MAKNVVAMFEPRTPVRRRHKPRGLNVRKKLGPKSHMRIR